MNQLDHEWDVNRQSMLIFFPMFYLSLVVKSESKRGAPRTFRLSSERGSFPYGMHSVNFTGAS